MSANSRFRDPRDPFVRGAFNEVGNNSLSLQQKVEDLINRVDAQDQKIQYLEKYKEKSKQTIIKMYREVAVQKRVLSVMENSLLPYIKRLTEETEIAVENRGSGASSQGVSTIGLNQRTRECMQGKSGVQVRKSNKGWFFNVNEDEGSSFIFKLFVASLAALTIYACAFKAKEAIEAWFNEVVYPLLDFGYNITSGLVENTVSAVFSNESDCMLCDAKDAVYSFATRAYSGAANVSAAIMEGVGR